MWLPDKEYYDQFKFPVLYPDESLSDWKLPPFNGEITKVIFINYFQGDKILAYGHYFSKILY